jgi:peptidoglycan/xylan/chitin deacetylase (PgdA/CDA1 family)
VSDAPGTFTISLDFELIWGTLDTRGPDAFRAACEKERAEVVDRLLALLHQYEVPATWCVLGHLFLESCACVDGRAHPDIVRPQHAWARGDWFADDPCTDESHDPIFYAPDLVERIRACPTPQEIGSHTFSHPILGDAGCSREAAASDLQECLRLAEEAGVELKSFAFPRNQVGHLDVLHEKGFSAFRGPEPHWYERPRVPKKLARIGHLADVLTARRPPVVEAKEVLPGLWNVPGSMIFFPAHGARRYIPVSVRVRRAVKGLDRAADEGRIFHLWFHPTNLADETDAMFGGLRAILEHAAALRDADRLRVAPMGALVP